MRLILLVAAYSFSNSLSFTTQQQSSNRRLASTANPIDCYNVDDDSTARSAFGTKQYWDELYLGRGDFPAEEYQWYFGLSDYYQYVNAHVPNKDSNILIPGIGNDPVLLDLLQKGYTKLTGTDYSDHAIERQHDLLSYDRSGAAEDSIVLRQMDARAMPSEWEDKFDVIIEKGCLDAIYLSGDGNLELAIKEFERVLKLGGMLISVSGVVPVELRKEVLKDWQWIRDGGDDLQAGCFVLQKR
jgi:SAM-dependent methyltransferase